MRITCRTCGQKAIIQSTKDAIPGYAKMYCTCTNPHCGHTFVATWSHQHTLSPGLQSTSEAMVSLVRSLEPQQRAKIIKQLQLI